MRRGATEAWVKEAALNESTVLTVSKPTLSSTTHAAQKPSEKVGAAVRCCTSRRTARLRSRLSRERHTA